MRLVHRSAVSILLTLGALAALAPARAAETNAEPALLQALLIDRLLTFIEWPTDAAPRVNDQLVVAVLGTTDVGARLESVAHRKSRNLRVRKIDSIQGAEGSHVVLLAASAEPGLEEALLWLRHRPILVIAEKAGWAKRGVAISAFIGGDRLHLEVNMSALRDSRIVASYQLLGPADLIEP